MKNQITSSRRRLRCAVFSTVSAAALCAVTSVYAQSSSTPNNSSTTPGSAGAGATTPSYDTSGSSTNTRTGSDRTRTGSGASTSVSGSDQSTGANSSISGTGGMRSGSMSGSSSLARADRRFIARAAERNMEELRLSELAAQQATNPQVRAFAQQMVSEHTQATTELTGLASRKGLDPMSREDYDQRAVTKLGRQSGNDFDKAYMEKMTDAHEDTVDLFDKASRDSKDPEVQAFATKMLPKFREHQQHARTLEQTVSSSGSSSSRSGGMSGSTGSGASGSSTSGGTRSSGSTGSGASGSGATTP